MTIQSHREAGAALKNDSPDGIYVVEPIEYVRSSSLPDNELLKNQEEVKSLLRDTRKSIRGRTREKISQAIAAAIAEVIKDQEAERSAVMATRRRSA
ncbi:hypothetical protein GCM10017673_13290 [Streptosporangium violaceochromogenes]|nr:hypothetical protein GCM10017673_13290 [Streptosporangium violaceochromogenes]